MVNSFSVHFRLALTYLTRCDCSELQFLWDPRKRFNFKSFGECFGQTVGAVMVRAAASQCLLLWRHLLHAQVSPWVQRALLTDGSQRECASSASKDITRLCSLYRSLYLHVGTCCVKMGTCQAERVLMLLTLQNAEPMKEALQKLEHPWLGTQSILSHLKLYIFLQSYNIIIL
jgi:hypothetical protein